ncbi:MAG: PH domain-containing protein [Proteobacteria bacterium]|nr:PH domain-containing protein [Pseudomonadota bacterium]
MSDKHTPLDKGHRLHKYSPLFILLHVIKRSIIPLVFGFFAYASSDKAKYMFLLAGILILVFSVLQYWFYHYWLTDEKIEIKEGILFKKNRKVPYTRIQNVNVEQNILQRFFKVATLQLESASGGKPEAVMRVVTLAVVETIKNKVKTANSALDTVKLNLDDAASTIDSDKPLHTMASKNVIKFGIISQKGMFYAAILFSFLSQNQIFIANLTKYLNVLYKIPDFSKVTLAQGFIYVLTVGFAIFIFLQAMSILWALLKFYNFKIAKHGDRLQASMGLLSKISATIPLKKIQLYRISENPLHKYFNAQTISIETAGGVNTDQSGIVMRWLAPYITTSKVKDFIHKIEPKIKLASVDWQLIPQRAWKRVLKRLLFILILTSAIVLTLTNLPIFEVHLFAWVLPIIMLPVIFLYAKNYVKKTGYYINDDIICFKSGVWFGKQSFVKINKIQTVEILESPFDRRNQMATLEIDTAGSNVMLHHVRIPYLELADAKQLKAFIQHKLKTSELDW